MKCRELVVTLRREMRQEYSKLSEKMADHDAIHRETQMRLKTLEEKYYQSNYGVAEGEEEMVDGEKKQEEKDEPLESFGSNQGVSILGIIGSNVS